MLSWSDNLIEIVSQSYVILTVPTSQRYIGVRGRTMARPTHNPAQHPEAEGGAVFTGDECGPVTSAAGRLSVRTTSAPLSQPSIGSGMLKMIKPIAIG